MEYIKQIVFSIGFYILLATFPINTCMVSLQNNTSNPVFIAAQDGNEGVYIAPNQTENFGSTQKRANFYLMLHDQNQTYRCNYVVTQRACSHGKHINLNIRDIMMNAVDNKLFTIVTYNEYTQ